jgi:DNA gyrase subunit A
VLTVTQNGYGKRTPVEEYPLKGRATMGVISIKTSERNGAVVGAALVEEDDEVMLITDGGTLVRTPVAGVSVMGRNTQGVGMIRLSKGEKLVGIERIEYLGQDQAETPDEPE